MVFFPTFSDLVQRGKRARRGSRELTTGLFFEMGQAWEVARWENGGNGAWRLRQPHNLSM